jgi:hypothetical protein
LALPYNGVVVAIKFSNKAAEKKALAFLLGRFSGRILPNGEHLVPQEALEALASEKIPFTVRMSPLLPSPGTPGEG